MAPARGGAAHEERVTLDGAKDVLPDVWRVEPVGHCNFGCIHCPTGIDPNKRRLLKPAAFQRIVDQMLAEPKVPRVVVLYHGGEPLLNKHVPAYVRQLKQLGVQKTVFTTNASLMTEAVARQLILAGLDEIKVSFDGDSPEENNAIRVNGNFLENAGNVRRLLELRRELGVPNPRVIVSNVRICNQETLQSLRGMYLPAPPDYLTDFFRDHLDDMRFQSLPAMVWPGYQKMQMKTRELALPPSGVDYCGALFETMTILSTGDVVACCYDLPGEVVFGNVFERPLREIWYSDRYQAFRDRFRARDYPDLCKRCLVVRPRYICRVEDETVAAASA
jgi:radical SAM protein with 4Fe4S-binding SPASM domain